MIKTCLQFLGPKKGLWEIPFDTSCTNKDKFLNFELLNAVKTVHMANKNFVRYMLWTLACVCASGKFFIFFNPQASSLTFRSYHI